MNRKDKEILLALALANYEAFEQPNPVYKNPDTVTREILEKGR